MRLWSLHPKYLGAQGLVALWREGLLANAALRGETRGYQRHPQLARFRDHATPSAAISVYLCAVYDEAVARGYVFDQAKIKVTATPATLVVTSGQLDYEWNHLMLKLQARNSALHQKWQEVIKPQPHPMFEVVAGPVESWERLKA